MVGSGQRIAVCDERATAKRATGGEAATLRLCVAVPHDGESNPDI